MKDTEFRSRLRALGMPAEEADDVTRQVRDRLQYVAAVADVKAQDHMAGLAAYDEFGDAGLAGYEYEPLAGIFKKIGKAVKKVGKVALKVASVVPGPLMVAAAVGTVGIGVAKNAKQKKANKKANAAAAAAAAAPQITPTTSILDATPAPVTTLAVAPPIAQAADAVVSQAIAQNAPTDTASLLTQLLSNQGTNMVSQPAQQLMNDVAQQGIVPTAAGPSSLPPWALPAGIGAAALLVFMATRKK